MGEAARFREVGVVEGFYGRVWEPAERHRFIDALAPFGLNTYLYCPKHEPPLAKGVLEELSDADAARLGALAAHCRRRQIAPWAGLHLEPPLDMARPEHLQRAAGKCATLHELGFTGFTILFDDMPAAAGDGPFEGSLAAAQAHAVSQIRGHAEALGVRAEWLVCPSLYTLDPMLAKQYGPFEPDYLARLDAGLPEGVAWLWTGPRVVSRTIAPADLLPWRQGSAREVMLWDNYPVNDAGMVNHLHLGALTGRSPDLPRQIRGYLFNPLLQPALGTLPGATCAAYGADPAGYDPNKAWEQALEAFLPEPGWQAFRELEALTRHCCPGQYLAQGANGGDEPLALKLERDWRALSEGRPDQAGAIAGLATTLAALERHLPGAHLGEAAPWLGALARAGMVFSAAKKGADYSAPAAEYRKNEAWVLGEWFEP